jgi:hypothetical protein
MVTVAEALQIIFLLLMVIPLASSSLDDPVKQGELHDIRVTPAANGTISTVTANITITNPDGLVIVSFQEMQKNIDSQDFNYSIPGSNTSVLGDYPCTVYAFSTIAENKVFSCSFEVNPSGKGYIPEITGPLIFGGIFTLMFLSFFLLVVGSRIDLFPMKVFFIMLAGVIAILNVGFVTGSFQEFLSTESSLSGSFGALYITFITLISAASIFLLMWIVIAGFKLYRIKRGFFVDPD